jgi:hypothetical protein
VRARGTKSGGRELGTRNRLDSKMAYVFTQVLCACVHNSYIDRDFFIFVKKKGEKPNSFHLVPRIQ